MNKKITLLTVLVLSFFLPTKLWAADSWQEVLKKGRGQEVYWNAWGGANNINEYISWIAKRVKEEYDIELKHVKLQDTADAVSRVLAEKGAGKNSGGSVDLIWINGENFATMKANNLLYGPFAESLPNYQKTDYKNKEAITKDFGVPVEGYESPWGLAQFVFSYDTAITKNPPKSAEEFLQYAKKNKGRVTYPTPPDFTGTTFLKQILYESIQDPKLLQKEVSKAEFDKYTAPLWDYLQQLQPYLWRKGAAYPKNDQELRRLLNDGEIDIAFSFTIGGASSHITKGDLPKTVRTYIFDKGTISNVHFVAIPYNSSSKAAAQVVANFLITPEAQAKKMDSNVWGDYTILNDKALTPSEKKLLAKVDLGVATLTPKELHTALPEPHKSWVAPLEAEWKKRFFK
jgi:putative thiamine transport system substrate-binding protein